jgi:hypothetical protein
MHVSGDSIEDDFLPSNLKLKRSFPQVKYIKRKASAGDSGNTDYSPKLLSENKKELRKLKKLV